MKIFVVYTGCRRSETRGSCNFTTMAKQLRHVSTLTIDLGAHGASPFELARVRHLSWFLLQPIAPPNSFRIQE